MLGDHGRQYRWLRCDQRSACSHSGHQEARLVLSPFILSFTGEQPLGEITNFPLTSSLAELPTGSNGVISQAGGDPSTPG